MATATATGKNVGRITQVIGSTFDAQFEEDHLPAIYNAVRIQSEHKGVKIDLTGEVQQHLAAAACGAWRWAARTAWSAGRKWWTRAAR
jgi:F0F1-type ATP synthase beta subunit